MSIDMAQFHEVFFEESFEGLDIMEAGLLELESGDPAAEGINTIFRAAHSIKGGSGTFGFTDISEFTHIMETLLDEMRDGRRQVSAEEVNLLLESVDCLREMMTATRAGRDLDKQRVNDTHARLNGLMRDGQQPSGAPPSDATASESPPSNSPWRIDFRPHENLLRTGNDVFRLFRELNDQGELRAEADFSALPGLAEMDPESSYISWQLSLDGTVNHDQITEVFEWVEDECDLKIGKAEAGSPPSTALDSQAPSPAAPAAVVAAPPAPERRASDRRQGDRRGTSQDGGSIRVSTRKVDSLINLVGELVITQAMLSQVSEEMDTQSPPQLLDGIEQLLRNTRELQESVMQIRMLPISFSFNRFPRLVHDLSGKLGKKIELKLSGENTELDKTVLEKIGDPLVHLVRNSLDHGIELPDARLDAGKPETGLLQLNAFHQGGSIVIQVVDDGAGLNQEKIYSKALERGLVQEDEVLSEERIHDLLFQPGFSTADTVSDVSGRGVGMDVVRRNIKDLGGSVEVRSKQGVGSTFTIKLPLTLAILDGQLVRVGSQTFIIPLVSIVESLQADESLINTMGGSGELYHFRDEYIPIMRLHKLLGIDDAQVSIAKGLLVVVEAEGNNAALFVDDLLGQQQVVIKSLETNFHKVDGVSGATILGDGMVALILDVAGTVRLSRETSCTARAVA